MAVHLDASPPGSTRPLMTNNECTPPSRAPEGVNLKRASRIGPLAVMNVGRMFLAPSAVATVACGLTGGDEPPWVGKLWQPSQLSRLKRGPSPCPRSSFSAKLSCPRKNRVFWSAVSPAIGSPVLTPGRTPGSVAALAADTVIAQP